MKNTEQNASARRKLGLLAMAAKGLRGMIKRLLYLHQRPVRVKRCGVLLNLALGKGLVDQHLLVLGAWEKEQVNYLLSQSRKMCGGGGRYLPGYRFFLWLVQSARGKKRSAVPTHSCV